MLSSANRRFLTAFTATSALLIVAVICFVFLKADPGYLDKIEPCYFSRAFHLYCPGCGGTRAVKALLDGDIVRSFLSHPVPVCAIIMLVRMWAALLHNTFFDKDGKHIWSVLSKWEIIGIPVVIVGFFIVRNLLLVFCNIDYLGDMSSYWH